MTEIAPIRHPRWYETDKGVWSLLHPDHYDDLSRDLAQVTARDGQWVVSIGTDDPAFEAVGRVFATLDEAKEWAAFTVLSDV